MSALLIMMWSCKISRGEIKSSNKVGVHEVMRLNASHISTSATQLLGYSQQEIRREALRVTY